MAEPTPLPVTDLSDVAGNLRLAADRADANHPKLAILITVDEAGELATYSWGRTDSVEVLATMHLATFKLSRLMTRG